VTIEYSATDRSYTVTTDGRSQTFRPADIDAARSSAAATVYIRTNGGTADVLTLTKPGTSGRLTYQYVAGGFWERTVSGATSTSGSVDGFAYGVETPDAALPRSGTANYGIDLIGVMGYPNSAPSPLAGRGTLYVDFAKGSIVITGEADGGTTFNGTATIASASNNFSGRFEYYSLGSMTGQIDGRFFGPGAQEVGAAWHVKNNGGNAAAGIILGRKNPDTPVNSDFVNIANSQFFENSGVILKATYANGSNNSSNKLTQASDFLVHYDAGYKSYTIVAGDKAEFFGPDRVPDNAAPGSHWTKGIGTTRSTLQFLNGGTHVTGARYVFTDGDATSSFVTSNFFIYGFPTANADIVRSGTSFFKSSIAGSMTDQGYDSLLDIAGPGVIQVNFATGAIDIRGAFDIVYRPITGPRAVGNGSYTGTAQLASSANSFTGSIELAASDTYRGDLSGRFYGPAGKELGAIFKASDSGGDVAAGTITASLDPSANASTKALADLTETTVFISSKAQAGITVDQPSGRQFSLGPPSVSRTGLQPRITYDPQTGSYIVREFGGDHQDQLLETLRFGTADRDTAASDAKFDVFNVASGNTTHRISLLRPGAGNPAIQLTYASFIGLVSKTVEGAPINRDTTRYSYFALGTPTAETLMPRSGTGTYNGLATGYGTVRGIGFAEYDISGTSKLSVNFTSLATQLDLTLAGRNLADGTNFNFGDFIFNGALGYSLVDGQRLNQISMGLKRDTLPPGSSGDAFGHLYGPAGQEHVTPFGMQVRGADGSETVIGGVAYGKRD